MNYRTVESPALKAWVENMKLRHQEHMARIEAEYWRNIAESRRRRIRRLCVWLLVVSVLLILNGVLFWMAKLINWICT